MQAGQEYQWVQHVLLQIQTPQVDMLHYGDLGVVWAEVKGEGTGMRKQEKAHTHTHTHSLNTPSPHYLRVTSGMYVRMYVPVAS